MNCNTKDSEYWGLRSVEYKDRIIQKGTLSTKEFKFKPLENSNRYELKLYFPKLKAEGSIESVNNISKNIYELLNGLEYEIKNASNEKDISRGAIKSIKDISIDLDEPISIWLESKLELKENTSYRFVLKIPSRIEVDDNYRNIIVIVGIGHKPFL